MFTAIVVILIISSIIGILILFAFMSNSGILLIGSELDIEITSEEDTYTIDEVDTEIVKVQDNI